VQLSPLAFHLIKSTCGIYGHLVPGGNRQAVDGWTTANKIFWNIEGLNENEALSLLEKIEPSSGFESPTY
jgi:hypothetical protein